MYYPDKPRSVSGAGAVLGAAATLLVVNTVVAFFTSTATVAAYLVVIAIAVIVGVAAGRVSASRGWGLAGGWILIGLALLILVLIPTLRDAAYYPDVRTAITWAAVVAALVYGALGITPVVLLSRRTARTYYEEYAMPALAPRPADAADGPGR